MNDLDRLNQLRDEAKKRGYEERNVFIPERDGRIYKQHHYGEFLFEPSWVAVLAGTEGQAEEWMHAMLTEICAHRSPIIWLYQKVFSHESQIESQ